MKQAVIDQSNTAAPSSALAVPDKLTIQNLEIGTVEVGNIAGLDDAFKVSIDVDPTTLRELSPSKHDDLLAGAKKVRSHGKRNAKLGKRGETAAVRFLERRGFDVIERNWTCFAGEADIIAIDDECLVFIEVKTRSDCSKGFPAEAVSMKKRRRYERIALAYLAENDLEDVPVRFDVISIVVLGERRAAIRHHINAYGSVRS